MYDKITMPKKRDIGKFYKDIRASIVSRQLTLTLLSSRGVDYA